MSHIINLTDEQAKILLQHDIEILKSTETYQHYDSPIEIQMEVPPELEAEILLILQSGKE